MYIFIYETTNSKCHICQKVKLFSALCRQLLPSYDKKIQKFNLPDIILILSRAVFLYRKLPKSTSLSGLIKKPSLIAIYLDS